MILSYRGSWPRIHETAFVAPSADLIGDVEIGSHSSIWFQTVLRGDVNRIRIGNRTNIQDHSMLHVTRKKYPLWVGDEVTVGHRVLLHGCRVGNQVLVGMGAILLDGVEIGDQCLIGAGSLLTQQMKVPSRSLVMGSPAKVKRLLTSKELKFLKQSAENYVQDAKEYYGLMPGPKKLAWNNQDLEIFSDLFVEELSDSFSSERYQDEEVTRLGGGSTPSEDELD